MSVDRSMVTVYSPCDCRDIQESFPEEQWDATHKPKDRQYTESGQLIGMVRTMDKCL